MTQEVTRMEMTRAWWFWVEANQHKLESIPTFEEFREKILPTLETIDKTPDTGVQY